MSYLSLRFLHRRTPHRYESLLVSCRNSQSTRHARWGYSGMQCCHEHDTGGELMIHVDSRDIHRVVDDGVIWVEWILAHGIAICCRAPQCKGHRCSMWNGLLPRSPCQRHDNLTSQAKRTKSNKTKNKQATSKNKCSHGFSAFFWP